MIALAAAAILVAAAVAVTASAQPQASSNSNSSSSSSSNNNYFEFRYEKSGGIAGLQKVVTYDFRSGQIKVDDSFAGKKERALSSAEEGRLRDMIAEAGFFDLPETFEPRAGPADYFSHSLAVTIGGSGSSMDSHAVAWVDPFAARDEIPQGLTAVAAEIEKLAALASPDSPPQQHPTVGKRRIAETFVLPSGPHDAEGHSSHQASYLLYPQPGYIYSGTLTVSSTLPADVLVYHDVTNAATTTTTTTTATTQLAIHQVGGRQYAATALVKNVTAATFSFAGSAVLVHTAQSEPFVAVATVDALRKASTAFQPRPPAGEVRSSFTVEVAGDEKERFVVRATDSQTLRQLADNYEGKNNYHVTGRLVRGDGGFNQPWSWHLDPASVRMAEVSIEVCDGRPSFVEEELDYWLGTVKTYCPWSSKVVKVTTATTTTTAADNNNNDSN